jgi:hypothetical protein
MLRFDLLLFCIVEGYGDCLQGVENSTSYKPHHPPVFGALAIREPCIFPAFAGLSLISSCGWSIQPLWSAALRNPGILPGPNYGP